MRSVMLEDSGLNKGDKFYNEDCTDSPCRLCNDVDGSLNAFVYESDPYNIIAIDDEAVIYVESTARRIFDIPVGTEFVKGGQVHIKGAIQTEAWNKEIHDVVNFKSDDYEDEAE